METTYRHEALGVAQAEWVAATTWLWHHFDYLWTRGIPLDPVSIALTIQASFPDHVALALCLDLTSFLETYCGSRLEMVGYARGGERLDGCLRTETITTLFTAKN